MMEWGGDFGTKLIFSREIKMIDNTNLVSGNLHYNIFSKGLILGI